MIFGIFFIQRNEIVYSNSHTKLNAYIQLVAFVLQFFIIEKTLVQCNVFQIYLGIILIIQVRYLIS